MQLGRIDSGSCETLSARCETSSCQHRDVIEAMAVNQSSLPQCRGLNPGSYSWTALLLDEPQGLMPSRLQLHYFTCLLPAAPA